MVNVKVLKRGKLWHWWCRQCMGGDWTDSHRATLSAAFHHAEHGIHA